MIALLTGLGARLQAYLAIAGAVVLAIGIAFLRGRKAATDHIKQQAAKQAGKVADAYAKIDTERPDVDASLERLRERARRDG